MTRYREKRINKILTIAIVILTVFILICGYELKLIREEEQKQLSIIRERMEARENKVAEVIYNMEEFGTEFDFTIIEEDSYDILDEYNGIKFIRSNNTYFVLNDDGVLPCEYLYDEEKETYNYRYCDVKLSEDESYRIDFSNFKFIKK